MSFESTIRRVTELDRILVGPTVVPKPGASGDSFEHVLKAELDRISPARQERPPAPAFGSAPPVQPFATPATFAPYSAYSPVNFNAIPYQFGQPTAPPGLSMLRGDVEGLDPALAAALERVAQQIGQPLEILSGARTRAEQEDLYNKFLNGTGNLAAPPGSSRHETGRAADVYVDGIALQNVPGAAQAAQAAGLTFPVGGEPWHVEPISS